MNIHLFNLILGHSNAVIRIPFKNEAPITFIENINLRLLGTFPTLISFQTIEDFVKIVISNIRIKCSTFCALFTKSEFEFYMLVILLLVKLRLDGLKSCVHFG